MRFSAVLLVVFSLFPVLAKAQDRANTILVMDGSGSMWGQIDGINKIVIAREVVGQILEDFPPDQNLGLTLYGHRTRGDCSDIETIVAPNVASQTVPEILAAVNALNPRGKTPMADAIIAAAEALRFTEEAATVILVSDGIETCNPDPCAAARALEQAGIDFTAHVVGFDVTDPEALAQMQCMADETGGQFITASNAEELSQALATVAVAPEPEPETYDINFIARLGGDGGPDIGGDVEWLILQADESVIVENHEGVEGQTFSLEMLAGEYTATARIIGGDTTGSTGFTVSDQSQTVAVVLPAPAPKATLTAPASAPLGSMVSVEWTGPGNDRDYISIANPDGTTSYINFTYISDGSPLMIQMPPTTGNYELRYVREADNSTLATTMIVADPIEVSLTAAESVLIGATIPVEWIGPDYHQDFISIGLPGERYINFSYTNDGTPAMLEMPSEPGTYELRYVLSQDSTVIATRTITVGELKPTLIAPETANIGASITIGWDGPDYEYDFISVGLPGDSNYINYTYTSAGNPLTLEMPTEPGSYELRYQLGQGNEIIATKLIEVNELETSLIAVDSANAGDTISVAWDGPDYERDFISVGLPGDSDYINYTYTSDGNPLNLVMPVEPGSYELRYQLAQGNEIIATRAITIERLAFSITAPQTASIGETISVAWEGPDYDRDYIAVGEPGNDSYINYTYTRDGSPAALEMPVTPGTYEVRYVLGQGDEISQRALITVTDVKATLLAEDSVSLSSGVVIVGWDGPDYERDFIAVSIPGEPGYETYVYTVGGNPVNLRLPETPGNYELRYIMGQGSTVIGIRPLVVTAD